jgi:hypothetical protein
VNLPQNIITIVGGWNATAGFTKFFRQTAVAAASVFRALGIVNACVAALTYQSWSSLTSQTG